MTRVDENTPMPTSTEKATFGAGCFWQVETAFRDVEGVVETAVGYEGGHVAEPTYEQVCTGTTGHAEVCQVTFDPGKVSYERLLDIFWDIHDPTQVNRQGPDVGPQYRTVVFTHSPEQVEKAEASKASVQERLGKQVATSVEPATGFFIAEDYHQCYLEKRRSGGLIGMLLGH